MNNTITPTITHKLAGWGVHLLTALSSIVGLFTLQAIYNHDYLLAFWYMWLAIFIDSIDGTLARALRIKEVVPKIDGALLDNILDYLNYVVTPAFLLIISNLLPENLRLITASIIVLTSSYQFTQNDAKTDDHFFKGFPSYWNIAVFYLYLFDIDPWVSFIILMTLACLVFVPIKYVYPSRLDYLSENRWVRGATLGATILYCLVTIGLLWNYPAKPAFLVGYTVFYICLYTCLSLYRTFVPLATKLNARRLAQRQS